MFAIIFTLNLEIEIMPDITCIVVNSLCIIGLNFTTWEGELFFKLKLFLNKALPRLMRKPLYDCVMCMSSVWGFMGWLYLHRHMQVTEWLYATNTILPYLLAVCGVNLIFDSLIYFLRRN